MRDLLLRRRNLLLGKQEEANSRAVCFEADGDQTVSITKVGSAPDITMQYSYNGRTWTAWDLSAIPFGGSTKVYVRGVNNTQLGSSNNNYNRFTFGTDAYVHVSGIAEALLDAENEVLTYSYSYALCYLFKGQTALRSTEGFRFEAQAVTSSAYYGAFVNCTSLIDAPELSAVQISTWSMALMFNGCTSLVNGPELLAANLSVYCYYGMFTNCKRLEGLRCHAKVTSFNVTSDWLYGVASSGTFYGHSEYGWASGTSGIPSGWTFVELND